MEQLGLFCCKLWNKTFSDVFKSKILNLLTYLRIIFGSLGEEVKWSQRQFPVKGKNLAEYGHNVYRNVNCMLIDNLRRTYIQNCTAKKLEAKLWMVDRYLLQKLKVLKFRIWTFNLENILYHSENALDNFSTLSNFST